MEQVAVHLLAVSGSSGDLTVQDRRTITLSRDKPTVTIGRASKNPNKHQHAAEDNGIFDCPIMSREHAQISMSSKTSEVFLKDQGSTHGTFLESRRLDGYEKVRLTSSDYVTFGQEVTNGSVTYPPKTFRVGLIWKPREAIAISSPPSSEASPSSAGFRVPDDDNESMSDYRSDDSIQIVNSRSNRFSIPSSDDDLESSDDEEEIQVTSSVPAAVKISAIKVPVRMQEAESKKSEIKEPTSDLLRPSLKVSSLQELLTPTATRGASQLNPIDLEEGLAQRPPIADSESEDEGPEILPIVHPRTAIKDVLNRSPSPQRQDPRDINVADDVELHDFGHTCETIPFSPGPRALDQWLGHRRDVSSFVDVPGEYSSFDEDDYEDPDFPIDDDAFDLGPVASGVEEVQSKPVEEDALAPFVNKAPVEKEDFNFFGSKVFDDARPRAPSPSDAALAKGTPANVNNGQIDMGLSQEFPQEHFPESVRPIPSAPDIEQDEDIPMAYPTIKPRCRLSVGNGRSSLHISGLQNPLFSPATRGDSVGMSSFSPSDRLNRPVEPVYVPPPLPGPQSDTQSSKIHIANLVNAFVSEQTPLKRKADEISGDNEDITSAPVVLESAPMAGASEETHLQDAQPRDIEANASESSQEHETTPATITTSVTKTDPAPPEGPTRKRARTSSSTPRIIVKRARTSSSSPGGIVKFISGMCVGAVGVLAAIISTVPANVYDEALGEASRAA